ncbi:hypothetical protein Fcan01_24830 [Folsomia candida]|uniref:Uncharacterized protein n=1 Tax=Folsomia candida TaxID=158441 RepID=A0A226D7Y1_FOLCA|nr:hypothetical protein Fcan01_24830 [Folsomia candida]
MQFKQPLILVVLLTSSFLILSIPFWIFDLNNDTSIVPRCDLNPSVENITEEVKKRNGQNFTYPDLLQLYGEITKYFDNRNFSDYNDLIPYIVYNSTFYDLMQFTEMMIYYTCINNTKEQLMFLVKMDELYPEFYSYWKSKGEKYNDPKSVFAIMIATTYLLLWERHSLHGYLQLCYVLVEAVHRTGRLIYVAYFANDKGLGNQYIYSAKYLTRCAKFDTFFGYIHTSRQLWLTILVFDLWKTFGRRISLPGNRKLKFVKYFGFAVLSPAVYICAGLILQVSVW